MITDDMLAFWGSHRAYPDILDFGSPEERSVLTYEQWIMLEELSAGFRLADQGLVSAEFRNRINQQLHSELSPLAVEAFLRTVRA